MPRKRAEWIGRTDDSMPGQLVRDRISAAQGDRCTCGRPFGPGVTANCDHIVPLADEGENRETNLQMLCNWCHVEKTSAEATNRAKARSIRAKRLGLDQSVTNKYQRPGKMPGDPIHYSQARGVWVNRATGEVIEEPVQ
jgi:5-methylcytosine-specific restriction endonuclease McrA